jgi:3-deoxy-D-arabino-heptulosonate 7-phosphate (DAHP) synthase
LNAACSQNNLASAPTYEAESAYDYSGVGVERVVWLTGAKELRGIYVHSTEVRPVTHIELTSVRVEE